MLPFIVRRLLAGAAGAMVLAASASAQGGSLTGRVINKDAGRPLGNARITVSGGAVVAAAVSSETGQYAINNVAPGTYTVAISRIGYQLQRFPGIVIRAGQAGSLLALE